MSKEHMIQYIIRKLNTIPDNALDMIYRMFLFM